MISTTALYVLAGIVAANLLILLIGSILFVRWVIKTIGVLRAADCGTMFDKSARQAGKEVARAVADVSAKVEEQRELVMTMTASLERIAESLSPDAVDKAIEARAQAISQPRIALETKKRLDAEEQVKRLEGLVYGMTGTAADLGEVVRKDLLGRMNPNLLGRVESFCAQRGVRVGVVKTAAPGIAR